MKDKKPELEIPPLLNNYLLMATVNVNNLQVSPLRASAILVAQGLMLHQILTGKPFIFHAPDCTCEDEK